MLYVKGNYRKEEKTIFIFKNILVIIKGILIII
jgi:hypothetical protein